MINRLIERRRGLHWMQKELAARSWIAQSEISKIERGRQSPTMDTYSRLAAAMSVDDDVPALMETPHPDLVSTLIQGTTDLPARMPLRDIDICSLGQ